VELSSGAYFCKSGLSDICGTGKNLSPYIRSTLAIRLGSENAARAKENQKTSSGGKNPQPYQISVEAEKLKLSNSRYFSNSFGIRNYRKS
jgi:hypothetical protein